MELWKPIPDLFGYEASTEGRIRNNHGRILKSALHGTQKYYRVGTRIGPKPTHRLVGAAFYGTPEPGLEFNHLDGDKSNNRPDNLEPCTHRQNMRHAFDTDIIVRKLSRTSALAIRAAIAGGETQRRIAARFHVSPAMVTMVKQGKCWPE